MSFFHPSDGRLAAWQDGQLDPADAAGVAAHLAVCPRCRDLLTEHARATALLARVPTPVLPDGLVDSIALATAAELARVRSRRLPTLPLNTLLIVTSVGGLFALGAVLLAVGGPTRLVTETGVVVKDALLLARALRPVAGAMWALGTQLYLPLLVAASMLVPVAALMVGKRPMVAGFDPEEA